MKKQILFCGIMCIALSLHAQQRPYYTQYILNDFIINPALAGIENYWDVKSKPPPPMGWLKRCACYHLPYHTRPFKKE